MPSSESKIVECINKSSYQTASTLRKTSKTSNTTLPVSVLKICLATMVYRSILQKLVDLAPTVLPIIIAYFEVVGLFGNINLIVATVRKKNLQTKHGVLLALTTFYQSMCLLGEIGNMVAEIHGGFLQQNLCFYIMIPYIWFCCMQSTMFLVLSLDTLFSVIFPLKHMVMRLWVYVSLASIAPVLYAALIIILNSLEIIYGDKHSDTVLVCNPILAMDKHVAAFWINWNGFSNLVVLGVHFGVYALVMKKEKKQQELGRVVNETNPKQRHHQLHEQLQLSRSHSKQHLRMFKSPSLASISAHIRKAAEKKRALISLMWLVTIFAFTWCTCMLSQAVVSWMPKSELTLFVESYAFIFGMMAYSANYYVYFARNRSYRVVFLEQLGCLLPGKFYNEAILRGIPQSFPTLHATGRTTPGPSLRRGDGMSRTTSAIIPKVQHSALAKRKFSEEPRRERHPRFY